MPSWGQRALLSLCLLVGASTACAAGAQARGRRGQVEGPQGSSGPGTDVAEQVDAVAVATSRLRWAQTSARLGDDDAAIRWCEEGLAAPGVPDELVFELQRRLASALARGGNAQRALELLSAIANDDRLPTVELRGARAAALDRGGPAAEAARALAEWRAVLNDATVEASYAEARLRARLDGLQAEELSSLADSTSGSDVGACFASRAGREAPRPAPAWVDRCQSRPRVVGVSLPRSGRLAGLGSEHLAAVSVTVRLLSSAREVQVLFEDSGSTAKSALVASRRLLQRGADWLVGPIAPAQVRAAAQIGAKVAIPGEARRGGEGVAPSLSRRLSTLVGEATRRGTRELVVLTPDNAYGRGVERLLEELDKEGATLSWVTLHVEEDSVKLASTLDDVMRRLRPSSAVLVADALARVAFVVRQIRRREGEGARVPIYTTSEGLVPAVLARAGSAMEGDVFAPLVGPAPDVARFDAAFERQEGRPPSDQARLVFRALALAWAGGERGATGGVELSSAAPLYVLKGGALVPLATQAP